MCNVTVHKGANFCKHDAERKDSSANIRIQVPTEGKSVYMTWHARNGAVYQTVWTKWSSEDNDSLLIITQNYFILLIITPYYALYARLHIIHTYYLCSAKNHSKCIKTHITQMYFNQLQTFPGQMN